MDRLNIAHTGSRIELPDAISLPVEFQRSARLPRIAPITRLYLGIAGFMGCGALVIVTASMLALHIQ